MSQTSPAPVQIPKGDQYCKLSIINTTCDITVPPIFLVEPAIEGWEWINLPTYSFYIKHESSGRELLFDLGARKDWENHVPAIKGLIEGHVPGIRITEDVLDIVRNGGVDVEKVEAVILSHFHFDHSGAPSKLPKSTKVLVGPGFKKAYLPGWPGREDSTFHEADFDDREVVEVPFTEGSKLGQFDAYDYFGDSSLIILSTPGHAVGHISALVKTGPDEAVVLGGDIGHFTGDFRPSQYIPLPDTIPEEAVLDQAISRPCPCSAFLSSHPKGDAGKNQPFVQPSSSPSSFYADPATSCVSVNNMIEFDANSNILLAIAHDSTSLDVFDFFPKTMNGWKQKNWKAAAHWGFLSDLPYNGKTVRDKRVDGLYKDGQKIRGVDIS